MISAPYRFVPLNGNVVKTEHEQAVLARVHSDPLPGGLSAVLDVEWAVETPLLIGETGSDPDIMEPMTLGDEYVIPGATIRGLLRSTMEISCFARLRQINAHHRYGLRDFQHDYYKQQLLDSRAVNAGWMRRADKARNSWVFRPCDWKPVTIESLLTHLGGIGSEAWLKSDRYGKYSWLGAATNAGPKSSRDFTVDWEKTIRQVRMMDRGRMEVGSGERRYIVASGKAVQTHGDFAKKVEYAFTAGDPEKECKIHPDAWAVFESVHCKPSRNKREPDGAWAEWNAQVEADGWIPVFYVGEPGSADQKIGLTRLFRLPSRNSVGEIRDRVPDHRMGPDDRPDMVDALFGWVDEAGDRGEGSEASALRGRIRCGFARLQNPDDADETERLDAVMMGPRPSFGPFYLVGDHDWSGNPFLAGRKRYPVRFSQDRDEALKDIRARFERSLVGTGDSKTRSAMRYLHGNGSDLIFRGEIRLHNVTPVELGAVLWALRLGEGETRNRRHAIGRGKAFGCGQTRVKTIGLRVRPHRADDAALAALCAKRTAWDRSPTAEHWMPPRVADKPEWDAMTGFLQAFTTHMGEQVKDWSKSAPIVTLQAAADPVRGEKLRREHKLNYLGDHADPNRKTPGHTAHMNLKKAGGPYKLPWG